MFPSCILDLPIRRTLVVSRVYGDKTLKYPFVGHWVKPVTKCHGGGKNAAPTGNPVSQLLKFPCLQSSNSPQRRCKHFTSCSPKVPEIGMPRKNRLQQSFAPLGTASCTLCESFCQAAFGCEEVCVQLPFCLILTPPLQQPNPLFRSHYEQYSTSSSKVNLSLYTFGTWGCRFIAPIIFNLYTK